jgi:hypothetical protein
MKHGVRFRSRAKWLTLLLAAVAVVVAIYRVLPNWENSRFTDAESGISITLSRSPTHPYLPEYKRKLLIVFPNGKRISLDLFPDTGGTVRMNVYREATGNLLLRDRLDYSRVDVMARSVEPVGDPIRRIDAQYLGAFDEDSSGVLVFTAASVKSESEPPGMMRD